MVLLCSAFHPGAAVILYSQVPVCFNSVSSTAFREFTVCVCVCVCAVLHVCVKIHAPTESECERATACVCVYGGNRVCMWFYPFALVCPCRCTAQYKHRCVFQGVNTCILEVWMRGRGSCRLSSAIIPSRLWFTATTTHPESILIRHLSLILSRASYLSCPTVYFLAQLLCVGVCTANEVNMIL